MLPSPPNTDDATAALTASSGSLAACPSGPEASGTAAQSAMAESHARRTLWTLVAATALIDFLLAPLARAMPFGFRVWLIEPLAIGLVLGQIGALAMWLVWGQGTFVRRLALHWAAAFGLMAAFLLGIAVASADSLASVNVDDVITAVSMVACALLGLSLAAQLPLWPLRTHFAWRIERPGEFSAANQPLSIRDILVGTAVVAVTLALARATLLDGGGFVSKEILSFSVATFAINLLIGIPALACLLRIEQLSRAILGFGAYLFAGVLLLLVIVSAIARVVPPVYAAATFLLGTAVLAATLSAPMYVLRACGYRLTRPRDRRAKIASPETLQRNNIC